MSITLVENETAEIINRLTSTREYRQCKKFLNEQGVTLGSSEVYHVTEDDERYILQYQLQGLDENESGVLELSASGNTIIRGSIHIDRVKEDGTPGYTDHYVLTEDGTLQKT